MPSKRDLRKATQILAQIEGEPLAVAMLVISGAAELLEEILGHRDTAGYLRMVANLGGEARGPWPTANQSMHLDARGVAMTQDLRDYINQIGEPK